MSHRDVYDYEMIRQRFSDSDVERVLSGQEPESETLARLAPALVALHAEQPGTPSEETISRLAAEAADIARSAAPDQDNAAAYPARGNRFRGSLRHRLATLAAAMLTFAGMTGIAFAADTAAPGDTLYGLDRVLEQVGINDGAATERIDEATVLAARGQVPDALRHLANSIESEEEDSAEVQEAADALRAAANNVAGDDDVHSENNDSESQEVRESVATMLEKMAEMTEASDFDGATFGQRVAEMARFIGSENGVGNGNGPPEDAGPPDDAGPPEDAGSSSGGGQGPPEDAEPPENPGPPAGTPGRP